MKNKKPVKRQMFAFLRLQVELNQIVCDYALMPVRRRIPKLNPHGWESVFRLAFPLPNLLNSSFSQ